MIVCWIWCSLALQQSPCVSLSSTLFLRFSFCLCLHLSLEYASLLYFRQFFLLRISLFTQRCALKNCGVGFYLLKWFECWSCVKWRYIPLIAVCFALTSFMSSCLVVSRGTVWCPPGSIAWVFPMPVSCGNPGWSWKKKLFLYGLLFTVCFLKAPRVTFLTHHQPGIASAVYPHAGFCKGP
jgi:hypothetical protein